MLRALIGKMNNMQELRDNVSRDINSSKKKSKGNSRNQKHYKILHLMAQ